MFVHNDNKVIKVFEIQEKQINVKLFLFDIWRFCFQLVC